MIEGEDGESKISRAASGLGGKRERGRLEAWYFR